MLLNMKIVFHTIKDCFFISTGPCTLQEEAVHMELCALCQGE